MRYAAPTNRDFLSGPTMSSKDTREAMTLIPTSDCCEDKSPDTPGFSIEKVAVENGNVAHLAERKKNQWDDFIESVKVNKSINSGIFKVTLHQLARDGEAATLAEMLENVPNNLRKRILNTSTDEEGVTALHLAARHNHFDVCKLFMEFGANLDSRGEGRATPLHYAARYKPKKKWNTSSLQRPTQVKSVISLLASSGAHVNICDVEGQTPLHAASIKGNTDAINQLLGCRGIAVECTDNQGMTALHMAATHGHVDIVKMLIAFGADLHSCDHDLMTPLHFACADGNIEIVRMILQKGLDEGGLETVKSMLLRTDSGKNTCLHVSVGKGHKEMVLEILDWTQKACDITDFVNIPRAHNNSSLHIAASQGHINIARILIKHGANVNARNDSLATALLLAAQCNYFNIVELLLEYKAEMEIRDKDNLTPLLVASKNGNLETISWLIENGADVTATDKNDKTCLMLAVEVKKTYAVEELLTYRSVHNLLSETDKNANSVLHVAAKNGHVPIIKILVDHGARIDFKNEDEATPVHIAALFGQHVALKELLDNDRSMINSLDENANTALHLAATEGHTKSIQVLLDHGANVELRNTRQWSALDCACAKGRESSVSVLLLAQSPVNPPKGFRTTPLHQACLNGHVHVVKQLLEWRADVTARTVDGKNSLDCAIDNDNRECVQTILMHDNWKRAMRNAYIDNITGYVITPVRKLITKMPDMAELAFSRCITDNRRPLDDMQLEVTLDYEFLDDMYTVIEWLHPEQSDVELDSSSKSRRRIMTEGGYVAFNDHGKPSKQAMTYVDDTSVLRHNHPLHIMVNRKRERLLQHPVVTGLLQYKWDKYGGLVYYSSLTFFLLFVGLLNFYLLVIPPPYAIDFLKSLANRRYYAEFSAEQLKNYTMPKECYNVLQSGTDYRGFASKGASGRDCVTWDETGMNARLLPKAGLEGNYCRNPENQLKRPWCYTNYSSTDTDYNVREICNIEQCPVYVKGVDVPLGMQCHFPFKLGGKNISECLLDPEDGRWCSYTYDYDKDQKKGKCSKESSLCDVDREYQEPCGTPNSDRANCEARGCCFVIHDEEKPTEVKRCYKKLDPCSDRRSTCAANRSSGMCVTNRDEMEVKCSKTCGFCNSTAEEEEEEEEEEEGEHEFLHLMSNYPSQTFYPDWTPGCFFVVEKAESRWGKGCHYKQAWQNPIRFTLLIFSGLNLFFLTWNYQWEAFQPIFFLQVVLFVLCVLLTFDFEGFDLAYPRQMELEKELYEGPVAHFQRETGLRQNWQWQCGSVALFLTWMDLLLHIRKIPYLGIYVVMFNDVFKTFVKFSLVFLLFILSFAFTFHTLLQNEAQFEEPFKAILKTTVMMVGEIDFGGIFFSEEDVYEHRVNYESVTYLIFTFFIMVMMIIIMNLLVGLAVGDIIAVKENATLERLKMQVELALEVEFSVPNFLRKRFVRRYDTVKPNRYRKSNSLMKAMFQNQDLSFKNIVNAMNPNKSETEEIRENVSILNHVIVGLQTKTNDVDLMMREAVGEIRDVKLSMEAFLSATGSMLSSKPPRNERKIFRENRNTEMFVLGENDMEALKETSSEDDVTTPLLLNHNRPQATMNELTPRKLKAESKLLYNTKESKI